MRILVMGGTGGFGSTICRLLADDGHHVTAASRRSKGDDFPKRMDHMTIDRKDVQVPHLADFDLVVDASGPFQGLGQQLMETAIAAGIHYVDIADDRRFVDAASLLDPKARAAGVCVVSGASSIPALSSAAAFELTRGMDAVHRIDVSISAGADAVFGPAVLHAMLTGAGRPVRWQGGLSPAAMSSPRDVAVVDPTDGSRVGRTVLVCDSPDLTTMPSLLPGRPEVRFRAGSELPLHNRAMRIVSWCVRRRLVGSGTAFSSLASKARRLTASRASGRSFMLIEAIGDVAGGHQRRTWSILATNGLGPTIPCLAVPALVAAIDEGRIGTGACSASGLLTTTEILSRLPDRDHHLTTTTEDLHPLYRDVLGNAWDLLPEPVRAMHDRIADGTATGTADVERGRGVLAALTCRLIGFPKTGRNVPVKVSFSIEDDIETWTRDFAGTRFVSRLRRVGDLLEERFGPLRFRFRLEGNGEGISMIPAGWWLWRMPLPSAMMPNGVATETCSDGRFRFEVPISMPIVGSVVRYVGNLDQDMRNA